jgi:hypothetical protein
MKCQFPEHVAPLREIPRRKENKFTSRTASSSAPGPSSHIRFWLVILERAIRSRRTASCPSILPSDEIVLYYERRIAQPAFQAYCRHPEIEAGLRVGSE